MKKILRKVLIVTLIFSLLLSQNTIAMTTQQGAVDWVKAQANSEIGYNVDGIWGNQCSDFGTAYINYLIDGNAWSQRYTTYNGSQYFDIAYPSGWQRIVNYDSFVPEPGDILVFSGVGSNPYGHVCVAIEGCTTTRYNAVGQSGDQNWRGAHYQSGAYFDSYNSFRGVIRPLFNNQPPISKPTISTISLSRTNIKVGESITFNFSSNNSANFTIGVDKGTTRIDTKDCGVNYTRSFTEPGSYSAYVTSWNSAGSLDSSRINFSVVSDYVPKKSIVYNNHIYSLYDKSLNWKDAEAICTEMGGHLAVITNKQENDKVTDLVKSGKMSSYFLGQTDETTEGIWATVSGEKNTFKNWNNGEPTNSGGVEDYLSIIKAGGKWNDIPNDLASGTGFICEVDMNIPNTTSVRENGKIYRLYDKCLTWDNSRIFCKSKGKHLATITSQAEQNVVQTLIAKGSRPFYFLGANDKATEKKWVNVTDEKFSGFNWNTNQPDNAGGIEDYLMIYKGSGKWNDLTNQYPDTGFILEDDNPNRLSAPAIVKINNMDFNTVSVGWKEVPGADGYKVYRGTSVKSMKLIKSIDSKTLYYINNKIRTGTNYYFSVIAYENVGSKKVTGISSKTIKIKSVLTPPSNLTLSALSVSSVKIGWNVVAGANGYQIYHSKSKSKDYTLLKTIKSNSYTDTKLTKSTTYYYKVRSYRLIGKNKVYSSFTAIKSAKTLTPLKKANIANGIYNIMNKSNGRFFNAYSDDATTTPWHVVAGISDGTQEQKFRIEKQNDGTYIFYCMNYGGNRKLSIINTNFNVGEQLYTDETSYPSAQKFYIYERGNDGYSISPAKANDPSLVIGISGILSYSAPLLQLTKYTGISEQWGLSYL